MMDRPGYDVIVVGARVAGAATAMLLARSGSRVLMLDRARLPSDALSSHQIQVPGVAWLARNGLLDDLVAAGTPAAVRARFDLDGVLLAGEFPSVHGVAAVYSPRRYLLDHVLVRAAQEAGAELRQGVAVEELLWSSGRVCGVRARRGSRAPVRERAALVIGADGKHSTVARLVSARRYRVRPAASFASYGYWSGLELGATALLFTRPGLAAAVFPTNDGSSVVFLAQRLESFAGYRRDVQAAFLAAADRCDDLGQRLRAGARVERIRTTPDLPHALSAQHGPGWALVGDAGAVMDPVTAQGITHALLDAERVADAVTGDVRDAGGDPTRLDARLHAAWRHRDRDLRPVFDGTARLARLLAVNRVQRALLTVTAEDPTRAAAFVAAFTGARPWRTSMSANGTIRGLGARGVLDVAHQLARPHGRPQSTTHPPRPRR